MENNIIEMIKKDGSRQLIQSIPGVSINFHGINNHIIIHEDTKFTKCAFILISNMHIEIGKSAFGIVNLKIFGNQSDVIIGNNFSCWGVEIRCHEQNTSVSIGDNCMFAEDILIYPTDVHTIFNSKTGELLNLGDPIQIGNHVWCNRDVKILKGCKIGNDVIIASNSLVTKNKVDNLNNVLIGGSPIKILKTDVNWSRETPFQYKLRTSKF